MPRQSSKVSIMPVPGAPSAIGRHLSNKSIETLISVQENEIEQKKVKLRNNLKRKLQEKKKDADTITLKSKAEMKEEVFHRVLEDPNCILPSLFDPKIVNMINSPTFSEVIGGPMSNKKRK